MRPPHLSIACVVVLILIICMGFTPILAQNNLPLKHQFNNLPMTVKPYVWWHWMGPNFSKEGITKDLEAMKAAGIGGATIFNLTSAVQESHAPTLNNPWPEQTYRSPAYWDALRHAAAEAERLELEIGLHNTVGYSTTGGPWIDEQRSMQRLVWSDTTINGQTAGTIPLRAPLLVADEGWGATGRKLSYFKDIAVLAVPVGKREIRLSEILDLTPQFDSSRGVDWQPRTGEWTIYRLCHASTGRPPHPVPDDLIGKTLEADKMSKLQSEWHWDHVLHPLTENLGEAIGKSFRHMLIDSYEAGNQNWTPDFREEFISRKGYDPLPWLLSMGSVVTGMEKDSVPQRYMESRELTKRFEWDYHDVINRLFFDNGFNIAKKKLAAHGLRLQFEPYGGPFSTPRGVALADLPMGEFWTYSDGRINPVIPATARAMGRRVVGAEAFTGWPTNSMYTEDPAFLKKSADGCFTSGVNRLILHHWVHQPFGDQYQPGMGMGWWGTHFGRNQTWFEPGKAFFAYLGRCQFLLQQGEQPGTFLCIDKPHGFSDVIAAEDFLSAEISVKNGRITLPSGREYPLLIYTDSLMLPAIAKKISDLVLQGAIVAGPRPLHAPGLQNYPQCDAEVAAIFNGLMNKVNHANDSGGKWFDNPTKALEELRTRPGALYEQAVVPEGIGVVHRKNADTDIFFLVNKGKDGKYFRAVFPVSDKQPELWQAEDGSIQNAPVWKTIGKQTSVELFLKGEQSVFVVFLNPAVPSNHAVAISIGENISDWNQAMDTTGRLLIWSSQPMTGKVTFASGKHDDFELPVPETTIPEGPWQVTFHPKTGELFQMEFPTLTDFSLHDTSAINYFSGTATYKNTIDYKPNKMDDRNRMILDLGTLNDIAEVIINGESAGVLWYPPYKVDITDKLKSGRNTLEIAVTNNWANRMIGDEQEAADFTWGKDRGADFGRALLAWPEWFIQGERRLSKGRVTFSNWYYYRTDSKLHPAGLVGPVKIIETRVVELSAD